jgi:hypothetical protein
VERVQLSGLCYMHAAVVLQHYLVAMQHEQATGMMSLTAYLRKWMPRQELHRHIFSDEGYSSFGFLIRILENPPSDEQPSVRDEGALVQGLEEYGPALVSCFRVAPEFISRQWQHLGTDNISPTSGAHAMLLVGHRKEGEETRFLLQNWWTDKPYVEVDLQYLISAGAKVRFISQAQHSFGKFETTTATFLECSDMDAAEGEYPEGAVERV